VDIVAAAAHRRTTTIPSEQANTLLTIPRHSPEPTHRSFGSRTWLLAVAAR
jgi:hypothetical protein